MDRESGSRSSWSRRLVCAIGATAAGVLAVVLAGYLLDTHGVDGGPDADRWIPVALPLLFVSLVAAFYLLLRRRKHYLLWSLLFVLPLAGLILMVQASDPEVAGGTPAVVDAAPRSGLPGVISKPLAVPPAVVRPSAPVLPEPSVSEPVVAEPVVEEPVVVEPVVQEPEAEEVAVKAPSQGETMLAEVEAMQEVSQQQETLSVDRPAAASVAAPASAGASTMPRFPWPPPRASGMEVLPTVLLRDKATLGDVASALDVALVTVGRHEVRYYAVPNGFAMVTRLEAIDEDGNSIGDVDRDRVDFMTYIRNLFWVPPGYYRMVVFVVTDQLFESTGAALDRAQANALLNRGFNALPPELSGRLYSDEYRTTALIYEFRKDRQREVAQVLSPGRFAAHHHLERIGWFAAAQQALDLADVAVLFPSPTAAGRHRQ